MNLMHRSDHDNQLRILVSEMTAQRLSRRDVLRGAAAAAALAASGGMLAGCGSDSADTQPTAPATSYGPPEDKLNFYGWANYDSTDVVTAFTRQTGSQVHLDVYNSNEEAIAKLGAAKGTAGYDILQPTGVYVPQTGAAGLLEPLDHARIPNMKNIIPAYTNQRWDPGNKYTACKDWGSTGFLYDTTVIKRDLSTWDDFVDALRNEASGKSAILDAPNYLTGLYAWRDPSKDWTSTEPAYLDAVENFVVNDIAPHVKAYDSYPGSALAQGKYALMMCWNGDARQGLMSVKDPTRYKWVLGAPVTELWMDNWAIVKGATHLNAAYAWLNYILDPANSYADMKFHGYNTGLTGIKEKATAENLPFLDLIFFDDAQVNTMRPGALNSGTERLVQILAKAKAKSAG
jgi:spermidine/putrescine transport system substrate-binding protein